jgi:hypothetical protein
MNPQKPATILNALEAAEGISAIELRSPMRFRNAGDRDAFASTLELSLYDGDLIYGVMRRIFGKTPGAGTQNIYSTQTHTGTPAYVRNASCWAADLDLTPISVWNSDGGNEKGGVLISRRHILMAHHFFIANGATVRFVDRDNNIVNMTLTTSVRVGSTDIRIGVLSAEVPTTITPARYLPLPTPIEELLKTGQIPAVITDKNEFLEVGPMIINGNNWNAVAAVEDSTNSGWLYGWMNGPDFGDSGSPVFVMVGTQLALAGAYENTAGGPFVAKYAADIQTAMNGLQAGYTLTPVDLTNYLPRPLTPSLIYVKPDAGAIGPVAYFTGVNTASNGFILRVDNESDSTDGSAIYAQDSASTNSNSAAIHGLSVRNLGARFSTVTGPAIARFDKATTEKALVLEDGCYKLSTLQTPASASAAGPQGKICWDANYIYVWTAANTVKRVALSSF